MVIGVVSDRVGGDSSPKSSRAERAEKGDGDGDGDAFVELST